MHMNKSILLACAVLLLLSSTLGTNPPANTGKIHCNFLFEAYEDGKPTNYHLYLEVVIGRDGNRTYGYCNLMKFGKVWFQDDKNLITFGIVDVEVTKLVLSPDVDGFGNFKYASFSLRFGLGDEQMVTIENTKEDARNFEVHARGVSKVQIRKPKLIDVEWRQIDKLVLPCPTTIVPYG
jgi:hypothetical protein